MSIHVAIVRQPYDQLLLAGRKTVECRLTDTARPPFGRIVPGERVYLKLSGGPFFAVGEVSRVWLADRLTPADVRKIRERFNDQIHGEAAYWQSKQDARYATLVWLRDVRPTTRRPTYKPRNMVAWYVLPDEADPMREPDAARNGDGGEAFEVTLTEASLRQRYVRVATVIDRFDPQCIGGSTLATRGEPITLALHRGETVRTDINGKHRMFRWRGWASWFTQCGLRPGDRLRFIPDGRRTYRVVPKKRSR